MPASTRAGLPLFASGSTSTWPGLPLKPCVSASPAMRPFSLVARAVQALAVTVSTGMATADFAIRVAGTDNPHQRGFNINMGGRRPVVYKVRASFTIRPNIGSTPRERSHPRHRQQELFELESAAVAGAEGRRPGLRRDADRAAPARNQGRDSAAFRGRQTSGAESRRPDHLGEPGDLRIHRRDLAPKPACCPTIPAPVPWRAA
jgi:hypothetical protein